MQPWIERVSLQTGQWPVLVCRLAFVFIELPLVEIALFALLANEHPTDSEAVRLVVIPATQSVVLVLVRLSIRAPATSPCRLNGRRI